VDIEGGAGPRQIYRTKRLDEDCRMGAAELGACQEMAFATFRPTQDHLHKVFFFSTPTFYEPQSSELSFIYCQSHLFLPNSNFFFLPIIANQVSTLRTLADISESRPLMTIKLGTSVDKSFINLVIAFRNAVEKGKVDADELRKAIEVGVADRITQDSNLEVQPQRKAMYSATVEWLLGKQAAPLSSNLSHLIWLAVEDTTIAFLDEMGAMRSEMYVVNAMYGQKESLAQVGAQDSEDAVTELMVGVTKAKDRMFAEDLAMFARKRTDLAVQSFVYSNGAPPLVNLFEPSAVDDLMDPDIWEVDNKTYMELCQKHEPLPIT
jgi:hypothetical protein